MIKNKKTDVWVAGGFVFAVVFLDAFLSYWSY